MLELKKISKIYNTGSFKQKALDNVSVNFRENEFVSILGPSGSGKTTLLNIIGGLDNYTSGDLIINGVSTKKYTDRDWDTYRNHKIGFVFQSYNLIPHQSILSNVELALTLSGVEKKERHKRAIDALKKVGLASHINKRPNQLSGGQMQRVAIARALVNNPDILLADEPTGALDSKTSVEIMNLLKEVAKDKLVIMVTHNKELALSYSTRIVEVKDGVINNDTNPYKEEKEEEKSRKIKKTNMKFLTALSLSLNNLLTKKGRTLLTAFAGSIGIIGIALILSLSSGMQNYIEKVEEDTLSSYPITLEETTMDTEELLNAATGNKESKEYNDNKIHSENITSNMLSLMSSGAKSNNLYKFKKYLEENKDMFKKYTSDIGYSYNLDLNIYKKQEKGYSLVNPDQIIEKLGMNDMNNMGELIGGASTSYNAFNEMLSNEALIKEQYEIVSGKLPTKYNEVVLQVNKNNSISDYALYAIGLLNSDELVEKYKTVLNGGKVEDLSELEYTYDEILNTRFKVLLNTDYYEKEGNIWVDKRSDKNYLNSILDKALELKVVGIIKAKEDTVTTDTYGGILYTKDLTELVINKINDTTIAKEQKNNKKVNIFTNNEFSDKEFDINNLSGEERAYLATLTETELADVIKNYQDNASATYESNLQKLGIVDLEKPSRINIYAKGFDEKESIGDLIDEYNQKVEEKDKISYTDFIAVMMSGVSNIINIISYVLMAFVSISLVVSSIMIGIITYISVLERTKEIGILRSIGASKKDISRVFNAETLIVGLSAGLIGVLITILLNIPINIIIKNITNVSSLSKLPIEGAIILILISVILTVIAGLIPAKVASKKDPVEALRTE